jgi:predicted nuclease with TOPRIM domain
MADDDLDHDKDIRSHIGDLVAEEHRLRDRRSRSEISADAVHPRLRAIEAELDQAWDLLRQRAARREFGESPQEARIRPEDVVERYEG